MDAWARYMSQPELTREHFFIVLPISLRPVKCPLITVSSGSSQVGLSHNSFSKQRLVRFVFENVEHSQAAKYSVEGSRLL